MKKAIIFDLDGTLLNSIADLAEATNYALSKNKFEIHECDKYRHFVGDGITKLIERSLPENARSEMNIKQVKMDFEVFYNNHYADKTLPYDGITQVINRLKSKGVIMAVGSNKPNVLTKSIVKKFFGDSFCCVLGNREGIPPKPNPQIVYDIMNNLSLDKNECIFIGDTNVDIATGKNAGLETIGCLWGFRDLSELQVAGADYIIASPYEIESCIN